MKIAHIVDSMEMGGAETLVTQMCRLQREQGHEPCVYAVAALGSLGKRMRDEGFIVQPDIGLHLPDATRRFFQKFKEAGPHVVHLHNPTPTIYAALAARAAGVPSIVSTRHSLVAPPRKWVAETKYAVAARFCDWIVGICDATTNNVKSMHSIPVRKIVRVYNGAAPVARAAKARWPPKEGFTLVFVGRLEPVKNLPMLFSAFRNALDQMQELRLWIVGDGTQRKMLEELAGDLGMTEDIRFWGQQLDVAPFLSAADALIMSSKSEGLPMSLLQGFSLGLPAIVTDVGGMGEVVQMAKGGLTVTPADPIAMSVAILQMASSDASRLEFSQNAQMAFESKFTLHAMVKAYMELYRNTPRAQFVEKARS